MSGFLYAIAAGEDRVKIGWSADPVRRLSKIQSDCPEIVTLLGVIEASIEQEREAHALLAPWRVHREWYSRRGLVAKFVSMLPPPAPRVVVVESGYPLKKWRLENRLSQAELANAVGVHAMTVSRWELGHTEPNKTQRASLSRLTGLSEISFCGIARC